MTTPRDGIKAVSFPHPPTMPNPSMLIDGNQALAIGAMAGGLKFMAAYPMTPITSIIETIADKGRPYNIVVVQPEDEIAAINMVVGAAYAGVRSMTATSGSGFDLMTEGISLAGITETPVVVVLGSGRGRRWGCLPAATRPNWNMPSIQRTGNSPAPSSPCRHRRLLSGRSQSPEPGGKIPDSGDYPHRPVSRHFLRDDTGI